MEVIFKKLLHSLGKKRDWFGTSLGSVGDWKGHIGDRF